MWQNLVNIIIGLMLILIALIASSMGAIALGLGWTFGIAGLAISLLAVWGIFDEMENRPRFTHGVEGDF